jgi:hypothetical protein
MTLEIQVLAWDRHKNVTVLNQISFDFPTLLKGTTSSTSLKSMLCLGCNTLMTDIKELAYDNVLYLAPPPPPKKKYWATLTALYNIWIPLFYTTCCFR